MEMGQQLCYHQVGIVVLCDVVLLSFGPTFWTQSVQFEVFTMNNMFISVILFLTVLFFYYYWREQKQRCKLFILYLIPSVSHCIERRFPSSPLYV